MTSFTHEVRDGYRVASRVILPVDGDLDLLALYVDRNAADRASGALTRPDDVISRLSLRVRADEHASFGSYFNAFPASYWKRWTVVDKVRLEVVTSGVGQLVIYRSTARGQQLRLDSVKLDGQAQRSVFDLPLANFGDGGWYWFDLNAGGEDIILEHATWWVPTAERKFGSATLQTTTLNKTDYVLRNLNLEADDADLLSVVDEILVVDQGTKKVREAEGFAEVAAKLGDKLEVIQQANLGGSGGFARGQYETVKRGKSDYVILMDDDISIEPETVARMVVFADMTKVPTIVGAHMLDLMNRAVLHSMGEIVEPKLWAFSLPRREHAMAHNFQEGGLRETKWLHSRVDVDYNGWWCCLIPVAVIKQIGLSLPLFIKWDDSEYGLRAQKAGFPTVSLPGASVWHISWADKDDALDWQAYFHNRNRLITALIHSEELRGGQLIPSVEIGDVKHLVSMQYYTVTGRLMAEEDVLAGPDHLHEILGQRIGEVRALAKQFTDSTLKPSYDDFPPILAAGTVADNRIDRFRPNSVAKLIPLGLSAVARQFVPASREAKQAPQTLYRHVDNKWWNVSRSASALVTNAEGTGIAWYQRNPDLMKKLLVRSLRNYARLYCQWNKLAKQYRDALAQLTSFEAWEKTFGIDQDTDPK